MDRRTFLKSTGVAFGVLTAGGFLAACGDGMPEAARVGVTVDNPATWNVISATFELLTGERQRFAFGLTQVDNTPVESDAVEVYTRSPDGEVLGGPYPVESFGATDVGLPMYRTFIDVPEAGSIEIMAVSGSDFGSAAVSTKAPADSAVPVPGQAAIDVATPTTAEALDVGVLCTRTPDDCSMHAVSLADALAEGRPIMLMFATPAYCQTSVCGPGVDTLEEVASARDWGDVAFIHAEIYTDEGQTVAEHIRAWDLSSEPWLFSIDRDGAIVQRLDGPMIAQELEEVAAELA